MTPTEQRQRTVSAAVGRALEETAARIRRCVTALVDEPAGPTAAQAVRVHTLRGIAAALDRESAATLAEWG